MTKKNRSKLFALEDPRIRRQLLGAPMVLEQLARSIKSKVRAARVMEVAVAIEIALCTAIRVGNISCLHLSKHLVKSSAGPNAKTHLKLATNEVKNEVEIEQQLSADLVRLIERFVRDYRPALPGAKESQFLFPTRGGGHIARSTLSGAITRETVRYVGVAVNPHLFRHFAAEIHLEENPGHYETVKRLLGHKRLHTTTSYYTGNESVSAARHYQETLLKQRTKRPQKGPAA